MKLAVSNIAWPNDAHDEAYGILESLQMAGLEIAPGKVWAEPASCDYAMALAARRQWERYGLTAVAMQSVLFGHPELQLFASRPSRADMLSYLEVLLRLCQWLGITVLVFGSPKNRRRDALTKATADGLAVPFFRQLGDRAADYGVTVGLEANPPLYGADWLVTTSEMVTFVHTVDHPNIRPHLDTGAMIVLGEDAQACIPLSTAHVHASAPSLAAPTKHPVHVQLAECLRAQEYAGYVSLEIVSRDENWSSNLKSSVRDVLLCYT